MSVLQYGKQGTLVQDKTQSLVILLKINVMPLDLASKIDICAFNQFILRIIDGKVHYYSFHSNLMSHETVFEGDEKDFRFYTQKWDNM